MYIIEDVLVSEDLFEEHFQCNLDACKGACCVEGDFGAPLDEAEKETLHKIYETAKPYLDEKGVEAIDRNGVWQTYEDDDHSFPGTTLREDGACAFLSKAENGIAYCGIETAYREGKISFKKPISCELYPIRYSEKSEVNFRALNYDRWEICNPACSQGKKNGIRMFVFLKDALIRKFGAAFYEEMERAAEHYLQEKQTNNQ